MKISRTKLIYALVFLVVLLSSVFYGYIVNSYRISNVLLASLCLVMNIMILYSCKDNRQLFLFILVMMFFNYSAIINYYYNDESAILLFSQCNTDLIKFMTIVALSIFTFIFSFGIRWETIQEVSIVSSDKLRKIGFWSVILMMTIVFFVYLDRGTLGNQYEIYNTAIFEYSYLLFIAASFFNEGRLHKNIIIIIFLCLFIFEDAYYGGRISSLQFILAVFLTSLFKFFNNKKIVVGVLLAVVVFTIVSLYRQSYSLDIISIESIIEFINESRFSLDSASNAYYSTLCAIKGHEIATVTERLENFGGFIVGDVLGVNVDYEVLPNFLHELNLYNIGGCWSVGYFYFWFGYLGVILFSVLIVYIFNYLSKVNNTMFGYVLYMVMLCTVPRWYLYTPSALFRGLIIAIMLLLIIRLFATRYREG